jgi:DNA-binding NtrC family response regulator
MRPMATYMPPRVLIIEPSRDLRRDFARTLERRGLQVQPAACCREALALGPSAAFVPDIVIAAYQPGDETASAAMSELRRMYPGVVVLLTTDAFATEQTIGQVKLLPRPSEPRALLELIRRAVTADSLWYVRRERAAS